RVPGLVVDLGENAGLGAEALAKGIEVVTRGVDRHPEVRGGDGVARREVAAHGKSPSRAAASEGAPRRTRTRVRPSGSRRGAALPVTIVVTKPLPSWRSCTSTPATTPSQLTGQGRAIEYLAASTFSGRCMR